MSSIFIGKISMAMVKWKQYAKKKVQITDQVSCTIYYRNDKRGSGLGVSFFVLDDEVLRFDLHDKGAHKHVKKYGIPITDKKATKRIYYGNINTIAEVIPLIDQMKIEVLKLFSRVAPQCTIDKNLFDNKLTEIITISKMVYDDYKQTKNLVNQ